MRGVAMKTEGAERRKGKGIVKGDGESGHEILNATE